MKRSFKISSLKDLDDFYNRAKVYDFSRGPLSFEVEKYKKNRGLKQLRLYRMWVGIIAQDLGYDHESLHVEFAKMYLEPIYYEDLKGETKKRRKSTLELDVKERCELLNHVEVFASEYNIRLPHPDDMYQEAMGRAS